MKKKHSLKRIIFFVTEDWYFCLHWKHFAEAAKNTGYEVYVVTQVSKHKHEIENMGVSLVPISLDRHGIGFYSEVRLLLQLCSIYRSIAPDCVHHVALKPVIYGTIAARFSSCTKIINVFAGLGYLFTNKASCKISIVKNFVLILLRFIKLLSKAFFVFQNKDDQLIIFPSTTDPKVFVIPGVGVDEHKFAFQLLPTDMHCKVLLPARLLWDKGIGEFIQAIRILKERFSEVDFIIAGAEDRGNPAAIPKQQIESWVSDGLVSWLGFVENMPQLYQDSTIVCLPSYREGLPTALLEAASCGRAIVTTNVPGCKDVVVNGVSGVLVPVKDARALAEVLGDLIKNRYLCSRMGMEGRHLIESKYSKAQILRQYLALYNT